jgi:hypothetical protein
MKSAIIFLSLPMMVMGLKASEDDWQIIPANRDTIAAVSLIELRGDSLRIDNAGLTQWIHVDSIAEIKLAGRSKFRLGAVLGFVGGGVIGGVIGHGADQETRLFSGLPTAAGIMIGGAAGFALGGLIGSLAGQDEVYCLSQENINTKRRTIRWLLSR